MKPKPSISDEQLARLRAEDEHLRPLLESEMPAVREEWRQYVKSLTGVVSRHSKEIDEYIQTFRKRSRENDLHDCLKVLKHLDYPNVVFGARKTVAADLLTLVGDEVL